MLPGSIIAQGELAQSHEVVALRLRLRTLVEGISSSIPAPLAVTVGWAEESSPAADWSPCGRNRFLLQSSPQLLKASPVAAEALVLALEGLLAGLEASRPLAFACRLAEEIEASGDAPAQDGAVGRASSQVATAEEEKLISEWVAEEPKFRREQWIVSDKVAEQFDDAVSIMRFRDKIYREWGFAEVDPNPRAIVCFYGPPGTGKSMGAHVVAHALGKKILCANYSQVESKYVGDAPKRLRSAFLAARQQDAVLFFDESDSFLGKRMENVSSGSEQAINSLRSEMFILLENFEGVVLFATNLVTNFDTAFESRVSAFVEVELPTAAARKDMIRSKLPDSIPLAEDVDDTALERLVELSEGFSGRHIRTAIQLGLVKAARHSAECGQDAVHSAELEEAFAQVKESCDDLRAKRAGEKAAAPMDLSESEEKGLLDIARKKLEDQ